MYTILIPYYNGDRYRERNIFSLIYHYFGVIDESISIVVSEQGSKTDFSEISEKFGSRFRHIHSLGSFNKAKCWNNGMKYILGSVVHNNYESICLLLDSDIIVEPRFLSTDFVNKEMEKSVILHPFTSIIDLQRAETYRFIKSNGQDILTDAENDRYRNGMRCYGGALFMRISDYLELGGYDERFDAWGHEDDVFYYTAIKRFKSSSINRVEGVVFHLYHPISNTMDYLRSEKYFNLRLLKLKILKAIKKVDGVKDYSRQNRIRHSLSAKYSMYKRG